tara:strand:+ start:13388 stop:15085 length:1698 start_codon:yes stop_codon:yes gene_type:complete
MIQYTITKKFFSFFTKQEKILFFCLIFSQLIAASLELLSIGSLLPVFKSITDPQWNEKYFGFINADSRIYFIFVFVILIFILKNVFLLILTYLAGRFRNKATVRIVNKIYSNYLNKKYQFHIDNNSSLLLRNMQYASAIDSIIMRIVNFYADFILLILALQVVLLINIKVTIATVIVIVLMLSVYSIFTKLNIKKYGEADVNYNTSFIKNMMEGIQSYKEILLSGKQSFFTDRNKKYKEQALRYKLRYQIVEQVPKYLIEITVVVLVLAGSAYILYDSEINLNELLPFLGIIFIGVIKIMPNILRIFTSYQQFKYLIPQTDIVYNSLAQVDDSIHYNLPETINKEITFNSKIVFDNVNFYYKEKNILNNINISIDKNSTVAIEGSSGSGKTTFLNILTGLLIPTSGKILIDNEEINLSDLKWQKKIGYVSQSTHLLDDTIKGNIAFGENTEDINEALLQESVKKAELDLFIENLPQKLDTVVGERGAKISGGQAQRIGLARAFYNTPEILILDEPTNSLDRENEIKIVNTLKKLKNKITIIIVSHNPKPLEIADSKFIFEKGRLI